MDVKGLLERSRVIAVVGCSRRPGKAAHDVPAAMQRAGFRIVPVNPHAEEILGEKCYPSLLDLPEDVDLVNVFRPAGEAVEVVRRAEAVGAPAVWLQLGIASDEARRLAERAGMAYVEDRCIKVERARHDVRQDQAR